MEVKVKSQKELSLEIGYRDCIILPNGVGISLRTAGAASFVLVVGFRLNFSTQILPRRETISYRGRQLFHAKPLFKARFCPYS